MKASLLQLPSGSEGLILEEAQVHQEMISKLNSVFSLWGYNPIHPPMVDFYEAYEDLLHDSLKNNLYRLIDRDGEVLLLRPDMTLFVIKHFYSLFLHAKLPLRLCYADAILKHEDTIDISKNEFYQAGAEIIGIDGIDADLECILLLDESLRSILTQEFKILVGSGKIFSHFFEALDTEQRWQVRKYILYRNWFHLEQFLNEIDYKRYSYQDVKKVFSNLGNTSLLNELKAKIPAIAEELVLIETIVSRLGQVNSELNIDIDLSEVGNQEYHDGISFRVYADNFDSAIASGGRYDKLTKELGLETCATGFSVMLSKLTKKSNKSDTWQGQTLDSHEDFIKRMDKAQKLRASGQAVRLS
jgi:ATP phosphoribosyltransferase regulatory subunit